MIFFIEGPSQVGKTTLCNQLTSPEQKFYISNSIYFKGAGQINIGTDQTWDDYNWYMHNIIERLDYLNNYNIPIIWDRGVSEAIYSKDSDKWIRLFKCHKHKYLINLYSSNIIEKSMEDDIIFTTGINEIKQTVFGNSNYIEIDTKDKDYIDQAFKYIIDK